VRLVDYLWGKVLYLAIVLFTTIVTALLIVLVFQIELPFALLVLSILLVGSLFALVPEYLTKRRYYRELADTLASLDKKYLLAAVAEYPEFEEGRILYDALQTTGKSMNDEIARFSLASQEYREYIEMWVHEIKTPIAALKLMSENSRNRKLLGELRRVDFLVEQVLFYARSSTVEKDYLIRKTDLEGFVSGVLKSNASLLIDNHVSVRTDGLNHTVLTDAKWTAFILRQLIDNSVKYGATSLEFFAEELSGGVAFFMRDNGIGIEEGDLDRVFDKGFTGENGRRFGRATGLGLYLCRKLCDKMGLDISAQSTVGEGTTMRIVFSQRAPLL
jgi:signal transduction histidine kinase